MLEKQIKNSIGLDFFLGMHEEWLYMKVCCIILLETFLRSMVVFCSTRIKGLKLLKL